jgi:hypothetical protein
MSVCDTFFEHHALSLDISSETRNKSAK